MTIMGKNFRIESDGKITFLGYQGYWKEKVLLIKKNEEKRFADPSISIYEKVLKKIKKGGSSVDNVLITPYDAIILLLKDMEIKPSSLKRMIEDYEENGEDAIKIKIQSIEFNGKIIPLIVKDDEIIATRNDSNEILP